jgi:peptide/nickel transport system permease protein
MAKHLTYWQTVWKQFKKHRLGVAALMVVLLFCLVGIYAPLLASNKPLFVQFQGHWYFPLFRYLFYPGFFTKRLDIFYNLLMFTVPLFTLAWITLRHFSRMRRWVLGGILTLHLLLFLFLIFFPPRDPAVSPLLNQRRQLLLQQQLQALQLTPFLASPILPNWQTELSYLTPYAQLNLALRYQQYQNQHKRLQVYEQDYFDQARRRGQTHAIFPSLWNLTYQQEKADEERQEQMLDQLKDRYPQAKLTLTLLRQSCQPEAGSYLISLPPWIICDFLSKLSSQDRASLLKAKQVVDSYEQAAAKLKYLRDRRAWLEQQVAQLRGEIMPLVRPFHWEDDAGGDQGLNHFVSWWDLTRINRQDMVAALIFGIRVSLSVGLLAIGLALLIGIPIGAFAGYYGGKVDLIVYRLIEIWESMPTFFMLLMVVAFLQSKSIFLVIAVIGFFGWTGFSRFIRGEFFRQKQLLYVEACHALGYRDGMIIFSHLLPNAIPPLLTLVPFAIMGAITSEAALSFLGLGEEGSNSWGILMDEGRSAFPSESYLLWPPAILLTILLVAIALVGDSLRDALDPKLHTA